MRNLIIYGGSFDPIHYGHLHTAVNVQEHFAFDAFHFLPCKIPPLKPQSTASAEQRAAMIALAITTLSAKFHFQLNRSEIDREGPSYTVDTLTTLRNTLGMQLPITWLLGFDVFCHLSSWHQWQRLLELANLLVIDRQGFSPQALPAEIARLLKQHENPKKEALLTQSYGVIQRFNAGHYEISSTTVRKELLANTISPNYLPNAVITYIEETGLYQKARF